MLPWGQNSEPALKVDNGFRGYWLMPYFLIRGVFYEIL